MSRGLFAHRRLLCTRHGCTHDPALADDPQARCPNGCWPPLPLDLPPEPPLPSLPRRAANFAGALARDVAAGRPRRTDEERAAILAICRGCMMFRPSDESCAQCGCAIPRKSALAREHCPRGLW